jgi:hypothetical protein
MGSTCSVRGRLIKQQLVIVFMMMMMMMMATTTCEISGSHSGVGEDSILLECDAVKTGNYLRSSTTMVVPSNFRISVLGLPDPQLKGFTVFRYGGYYLLIGRASYLRRLYLHE